MRLLIVEDSPRLRNSLSEGLRRSGYAVDAVADGREGFIYARTTEYDLVILDLMLPEMDGLSVLRRLREEGIDTHVLILSARDRVEHRVEGLRCGADDYLVKPFSFDELLARVEALTRRRHDHKSNIINIGRLMVDLRSRVVHAADQPLNLTPREYSLLEYLALEAGRPVTRQEIEEHIYDSNNPVWSNSVDSAVYALRRKLSAAGLRNYIVTRRGVGYELLREPPDETGSA